MTPRRATAILCALALTAAIAACGEEADEPDEVVADEPPAEPEATPADEPTEPAEEEPGEDAADDAPAMTGPYTLTYLIEDPDTGSEEITYAVDGDDIAMITDDDGEEMRVIFRDDTMTNCFGGEGQWQCIQGPANGAGIDPLEMTAGLGSMTRGADAFEDEGWGPQEAETIAGRAATCAHADGGVLLGEAPGGQVEACVDDETGTLLKVLITDEEGATGGMTVTAFEPAADPALFEYPAEPMVIGEDGIED